MTQPRLPQTEEAQYRYDDDHRSDEPNDIVHDLSPLPGKARAPVVEERWPTSRSRLIFRRPQGMVSPARENY